MDHIGSYIVQIESHMDHIRSDMDHTRSYLVHRRSHMDHIRCSFRIPFKRANEIRMKKCCGHYCLPAKL